MDLNKGTLIVLRYHVSVLILHHPKRLVPWARHGCWQAAAVAGGGRLYGVLLHWLTQHQHQWWLTGGQPRYAAVHVHSWRGVWWQRVSLMTVVGGGKRGGEQNNHSKEGLVTFLPTTEAAQQVTTSQHNERSRGQHNTNASATRISQTWSITVGKSPTLDWERSVMWGW